MSNPPAYYFLPCGHPWPCDTEPPALCVFCADYAEAHAADLEASLFEDKPLKVVPHVRE